MVGPAEGAPVPPLALAVALASAAAAAALANCSLLAALLNSSTTGLFSLLLQLTIADVIMGAAICTEIWSYNLSDWMFGNGGCIAYRGLSVLAATASAYLIATIALHTLATANLDEKTIARRLRKNNPDEDEEIRSSRHSLVTSSDSSTPPRTMNVDYRVSVSRVSVTQPSLFVWILAVSLSVADFNLASIVQLDYNTTVCTIVDSSPRLHLYSILVLFNSLLPAVFMCVATALVIIKLKSKGLILSHIVKCESLENLKFSLCLIFVYFMLCVPRSILNTYNTYVRAVEHTHMSLTEYIQPTRSSTSLGMALSGVYLISILVRPIICIFLLPSVRKSLSYGRRPVDNV